MSNRMPCVGTVIGLSALLFATIVQSGPTIPNVPATCDPNGPFKQPLWTCDVCGNYEVGSAPWRCGPYNATFDDIPTEYLGGQNYQGVGWAGFEVVNGTGRALRPASPPQYAHLPSFRQGFLNLTRGGTNADGGNLHSLQYGCTAAGDPTTPIGCRVAFEGVCINYNNATLVTSSTVLNYTPHGPNNGSLAQSGSIGPQGGYWCYNFNVVPMDAEYPVQVDLYIDEVLHADWVYTSI